MNKERHQRWELSHGRRVVMKCDINYSERLVPPIYLFDINFETYMILI